MNLSNYYLHGICASFDYFKEDQTLDKLNKILSDGYLFSRNKAHIKEDRFVGWNSYDYISLCDYNKKDIKTEYSCPWNDDYYAYYQFITQSLALMIDKKELNTITPKLMPPVGTSESRSTEMYYLSVYDDKRYSDLPDEVQVKDEVCLDHLRGITLPIEFMVEDDSYVDYTIDKIWELLEKIQKLLKKYNYNINIYDLDTRLLLSNKEDIENVYTLTKKRLER